MVRPVLCSVFLLPTVGAFAPFSFHGKDVCAVRNANSELHVVDPVFVNVGVAVVSAAAGAASQVPRMQELDRELAEAKHSLVESEEQMAIKMSELEEKLFRMDEEFEGQTEKMRKQFDLRTRDEVERITEKIKLDYEWKMKAREREKVSNKLLEELNLTAKLTEKENELFDLRYREAELTKANAKLEQALLDSAAELEKLEEMSKKKGGRWLFF